MNLDRIGIYYCSEMLIYAYFLLEIKRSMNKTEALFKLLSSDTAPVNHSELPVVSYSCSYAQKRSGNNFKA